MTDSQRWLVAAGGAATAALLWALAPVLTPFAAGALLAYMGDPLVDRLEARGRSRTAGVVIVFTLFILLAILLLVVLLPLLEQQIAALIRKLPLYIDWVQTHLLPGLSGALNLDEQALTLDALKKAVSEHWKTAGGLAMGLVAEVSKSGAAVIGGLVNLVLVPVVTFYLLRDWDRLVERIHGLLPRSREAVVVKLARECDRVLAEFFRGQLMVMAALGTIYTAGLWLVGLELALLVGLIAGLVSFVPYMGFLLGIVMAGVAAFFQFQELLPLVWVVLVFGVGQAVEGMVLTPLLVGDRIGLHPVAVIFAVLAGGQLFGFLGVLLALPAAAVVAVLLRHLHEQYRASELYQS